MVGCEVAKGGVRNVVVEGDVAYLESHDGRVGDGDGGEGVGAVGESGGDNGEGG